MNTSIPILYANCIPVKGVENSIICDVQRNSYVSIPNDLYKILKEQKGLSLFEIKKFYKNQYDDIIDEYFQILSENEFAFFTDTPKLFPEMSMEWHEPFEITNTIIDIDKNSNFDIDKVLKELSNLHCKFIQFRFYNKVKLLDIESILKKVDDLKSNTLGVEFNVTYNTSFKNKELENLFEHEKRLSTIVFYSSPIKKNIYKLKGGTRYIIHTPKRLVSKKNCGIANNTSFSINIKSFTESINHNSCLNRKISIDTNGNIKNCPSMPQSFGNIRDTTLEEALNHPDFKIYWNITKDDIKVCKDCEFRYICTDCRAYLETPKDIYSKPLKCGYDPYTNKWKEWSINPLKQKAIVYYGMQDLVKKDAI